MKTIKKEEVVFRGEPFTYHIFIRDENQAKTALDWLGRKRSFWNGTVYKLKMTDRAFREGAYNIVLTVNVDEHGVHWVSFADYLTSPDDIRSHWARYVCIGYIEASGLVKELNIKRNTILK